MIVFASLSLPLLLLAFGGAAAVVWFAGVRLSDTTDVLAVRFGLGQALGGAILLAIATNLPEIAITVSAALGDRVGVAVGNILGGIAIQTAVLALLDAGAGGEPLTYRAASLIAVLEGALVIAVLAVVVMGSQLPAWLIVDRVTPEAILIVVLWAVGLRLIGTARKGLPWRAAGDGDTGDGGADTEEPDRRDGRDQGTARTALVFAAAAAATLAGGVVLERSGEAIAGALGMSGVVFGATLLAAATALPEVSTGLAAVRLGNHELAVSDIFGGNAFLPVLFLPAAVLSGQAVLPGSEATDIYLTALGSLLTAVYVVGLVFRSRRRILRLGIDSVAVLVLYLVGIAGLVAIAQG